MASTLNFPSYGTSSNILNSCPSQMQAELGKNDELKKALKSFCEKFDTRTPDNLTDREYFDKYCSICADHTKLEQSILLSMPF